jgi:hypothetical protein
MRTASHVLFGGLVLGAIYCSCVPDKPQEKKDPSGSDSCDGASRGGAEAVSGDKEGDGEATAVFAAHLLDGQP